MAKTTYFFYKSFIIIISSIVISILVFPAIPGIQALWWEKLDVNVEVKTGDFNYPRSKGYWAHCIKQALEKGEKLEELESYLLNISSSSKVFKFSGSTIDILVEAYNILMSSAKSRDMSLKLKSQLLALWLNYVSGYASGHSIPASDGSELTAIDIIEIAENVLVNNNIDKMEETKNLCEAYNTWWE